MVGGLYGYARMKPHRTTRSVSLCVLAAGPGANLAIFLAVWAVLSFPAIGELRTITFFDYQETIAPLWLAKAAGLLALVNLAMFVFNLLPAYPLDGGRIVDQMLSRVVTPQKGILISAVLGMGIGAVMIHFGVSISTFIAIIGIFIVLVNLGRLRGRRPRQSPPKPLMQRK